MLNKNVCPNCGQLYDTDLPKCPLCGTESQVLETEAPAPKPSSRRSRRAERKQADRDAERRREDAEEDRQMEEKKRPRKEAPLEETPVRTPAPDNQKKRPAPPPVVQTADRTRVPRVLLVLTTLVLLATLVVGGSYLLWKTETLSIPFYDKLAAKNQTETPTDTAAPSETPAPSTTAPRQTEADTVPCTRLSLEPAELTFTEAGQTIQILAAPSPADTTDEITFTSADESIVKVGGAGLVTAIAAGDTVITVTCGAQSVDCPVHCNLPAASTEEVTVPPEGLILVKDDITFLNPGESYTLTFTNLPAGAKVVWTSDDETVATVDGKGLVIAVGKGTTKVHATFGDETTFCWVRCRFS